MISVTQPLLARWLVDGEVTNETVLQPWTGYASACADTVIETGVSN